MGERSLKGGVFVTFGNPGGVMDHPERTQDLDQRKTSSREVIHLMIPFNKMNE